MRPNIPLTHTASRRSWSSYAPLSTSAVFLFGWCKALLGRTGPDRYSKGAVISVATTPVKRRTVCAKTEPCALVNATICGSECLWAWAPLGIVTFTVLVPSLVFAIYGEASKGRESWRRPRCFKRRWPVPNNCQTGAFHPQMFSFFGKWNTFVNWVHDQGLVIRI